MPSTFTQIGTSGVYKVTPEPTGDAGQALNGNFQALVDADAANAAAIAGKAATSHAHAQADVTGLVAALAALAPKASPDLTGTPTAPTAAGATDSAQLATTAFVQGRIAALLDTAPANLDTLREIAAQLADDGDALAALTASLAGKAATSHVHALADVTGLVDELADKPTVAQIVSLTNQIVGSLSEKAPHEAPTFTDLFLIVNADGDNVFVVQPDGEFAEASTSVPFSAPSLAGDGAGVTNVDAASIGGLAAADVAPLDSPALTGIPTAPTPATSIDSTQLATTAFVQARIAELIDTAPANLDTLQEIAAALADDDDALAALTTTVSGKAAKSANLSDLNDAAAARTNLGLGSAATSAATEFAGASHVHAQSDVTGLASALGGKSDLGHGHAQADVTGLVGALAAKAPTASPAFTGTPTFAGGFYAGGATGGSFILIDVLLGSSFVRYKGSGASGTGFVLGNFTGNDYALMAIGDSGFFGGATFAGGFGLANYANNAVQWLCTGDGRFQVEKSLILKGRSAAPAAPIVGEMYYDTDDGHFYGWNGTAWKQLDN